MKDYKPAPGEGGDDGDSQSDRDGAGAGSDVDQEQQRQQGSSGDEGEEPAAGAAEAEEGGGKKAKKRRKRGPKLSALEFEASRQMARQIAESPTEDQADWLWASYQQVGSHKAGGMHAAPAARRRQRASDRIAQACQLPAACCGTSLCPCALLPDLLHTPLAAGGGCKCTGAWRPRG